MSSAAETINAQGHVPIALRQYLSSHQLRYRAVSPEQAVGEIIESILLSDDIGRVQLLLPADRLLDLAALRQQTGRDLQAASITDRSRLLSKLGLQELPALDGLAGIETLIDQSVFACQRVSIQSGHPGILLDLDSPQALKQKDQTQRVDATVAVPEVNLDYELSLFELDRDAIEDSISRFTAKRIRQRLQETLEIPPLPATAQEIIRLRVDPNADINKLSALVEKDPSLAAQVISWASSSYYAAPGSIKSVQDAIVRVLGYDLVMNLSLGLALGRSLEMPGDQPAGFTPYWQEAVYTAAMVGELNSKMPREHRPAFGLCYLGGLLHNFGYLVMAHVFKPHFSTCCRLWEANPHLPPQVVEDHVLGINRDQIAASLLESWNIPPEVCLAIRHARHQDYFGTHADYAQLLRMAVQLTRNAGLTQGPRQPVEPGLYQALHLEPEQARAAVEHLVEARESLNALAQGMQS